MDISQDMNNARVLQAGVRHIFGFRNEPERDWSTDSNTVRNVMVFVSFFLTYIERFRLNGLKMLIVTRRCRLDTSFFLEHEASMR